MVFQVVVHTILDMISLLGKKLEEQELKQKKQDDDILEEIKAIREELKDIQHQLNRIEDDTVKILNRV